MHVTIGNKYMSRQLSTHLSGLWKVVARQDSRLVGKPTMWCSNRSDTNRAVQAQKMARDRKFWI